MYNKKLSVEYKNTANTPAVVLTTDASWEYHELWQYIQYPAKTKDRCTHESEGQGNTGQVATCRSQAHLGDGARDACLATSGCYYTQQIWTNIAYVHPDSSKWLKISGTRLADDSSLYNKQTNSFGGGSSGGSVYEVHKDITSAFECARKCWDKERTATEDADGCKHYLWGKTAGVRFYEQLKHGGALVQGKRCVGGTPTDLGSGHTLDDCSDACTA